MQLELDLKATVFAFPLDRCTSLVIETARTLDTKHGAAATVYWRRVLIASERHLASLGFPEAEIERQLLAFFDAVQIELVRQSFPEQMPGGAA